MVIKSYWLSQKKVKQPYGNSLFKIYIFWKRGLTFVYSCDRITLVLQILQLKSFIL